MDELRNCAIGCALIIRRSFSRVAGDQQQAQSKVGARVLRLTGTVAVVASLSVAWWL
jgi:hypothetical protein